MQKTIEVTIILTADNEFTLKFYEPESGDFKTIEADDSFDGSLVDKVGNEILSWVSLMREFQQDEEQECKDVYMYPDITRDEAIKDIVSYLNAQPNEYFEERSTTKEEVLNDRGIILSLANEHLYCVNRIGCDREWSCKDACDNDPGFYPEEN